jgi:nitroimidazol reductase NimA-like FMN-containing flavoprotein (pyridoxamine 5'-phosphate oxidase superfamily)
MSTDLLPVTERTRIHRLRERQVRDRATLNEILDAGLVAHLAACLDDGPALLPVAYARDGDRLLLHGSTGAGLLRAAADGTPIAVAVTHVDGLVFARSVFDSSMNYRSAVIYGTARVLHGEERLAALRTLSEHLMPGRWDEVRPPTAREVAATLVLALPLDEASVKVRAGGPTADPADDRATWAGVLPLAPCAGDPVSAADLPPDTPLPPSIHAARHRHGHRPTHQP